MCRAAADFVVENKDTGCPRAKLTPFSESTSKPRSRIYLHVLEKLFTLGIVCIKDRSLVGELFLLGHVVVVLKSMAV